MGLPPLLGLAAIPLAQGALTTGVKSAGTVVSGFAELLGSATQGATGDQSSSHQRGTLLQEIQKLFASRGVRGGEQFEATLSETGELNLTGTIPGLEAVEGVLNGDPQFLQQLKTLLEKLGTNSVTVPGEKSGTNTPLFPVNRQ